MSKNNIRESIPFLACFEHNRKMNENYREIGMGDICGCGVCNGYVAIPPEHPLYTKSADEAYESLQKAGFDGCHYGFTYGDTNHGKLDSEKMLCDELPTDFDKWWVFGFDTCHCEDNLKTWNEAAVISETIKIKEQLDDYRHLSFARDCKCAECGKDAVAFWPCIDPDIPAHPYCQACLDKARIKMMVELTEADRKRKTKKK